MPLGKVSYNSDIQRHPTRPAWYFNFHMCGNRFNELSTPCQIRTGTFVETNRLALNALPYFESCSFRCFCKFYLLTGTPSTIAENHVLVATFLRYIWPIALQCPTTALPFKLKRYLIKPRQLPTSDEALLWSWFQKLPFNYMTKIPIILRSYFA